MTKNSLITLKLSFVQPDVNCFLSKIIIISLIERNKLKLEKNLQRETKTSF
jgi:hypothetical protein